MMVSIQGATVRHLNTVLFKQFSLYIDKGEQIALIGDSGAGKTALLHTIHGNFNITNGERVYPYFKSLKQELGIDDPLFSYDKMIAFIRQQAHFKNKENQANFFYQQRYHAYFSEGAAKVKEYLEEEQENVPSDLPQLFSLDWIIEKLQLKTLLDKTLIQLSNGETRRLMIAKALLEQPLLLLMDNPFIGLDHATRPILNSLLEEIREKGTTIVMATSPREIPESITKIIYLKNREIAFQGSKAEFEKLHIDFYKTNTEWQPDEELLEKIRVESPFQDTNYKYAAQLNHVNIKSGGKEILKDINWTIKNGEKWALVGHNGAGKSTLLSLLNGDHPQAYANDIYIFDKKKGSGESIWELKRRIGYISPEMHQFFKGKMTVIEVVLSGLSDVMFFRFSKAEKKEVRLAHNWLKLLQLDAQENLDFKDLSTGQQRLVLLLRALIKNPPLLILDEPCQGLDVQQRAHFKNVVNKTCNYHNKTVLYVSHYKEDIPNIINEVLELENGEIKA